jgi:hypothetical protein
VPPGRGEGRIYLGGTASPAIDQPTGAYTATIRVMLVSSTS